MSNWVKGEGSIPCEWMIVGEGPGWEEDRDRRPFVGKTGQELNRHLDGYRVPARHQWYLDNIFHVYGGKKHVWTSEEVDEGHAAMDETLKRVRPSLVVTLGRYATRYFLGDVDMEDVHSLPWTVGTRVIFPIYHPAAAMHSPDMAAYVTNGFHQLGEYFNGELEARVLGEDPIKNPHYEEITTIDRLRETFEEADKSGDHGDRGYVAIDTEGWPDLPWSLQFSFEPGTGYLIRAVHRDLLKGFGALVCRSGRRVVYHSALHDLQLRRVFNIDLPPDFDDTAALAYYLQVEPQGLKPLCLRHSNMLMRSYTDLTADADERIAQDYLVGIYDLEEMEWMERRQDAFWVEVDKGRRVSKLPTVPKSALHKSVQRCLQSKRSRGLWEDQVEDTQVAGYNKLGPMPRTTLDHVPFDEARDYACADSDGTGRIFPQLLKRVRTMGLEHAYRLDLSTYPLLDRMMHVGFKPDLPHFARLSTLLQGELDDLQYRIADATARPEFNANSGDQVAEYLFDELGLDAGGRHLDSGRQSTNDKILEALEREHPELPVIGDIRDYRATYKLKNTFCDRIPDYVNRWPHDGRVHTTLRTNRVVTGRLSSSDPNEHAQPHDPEGLPMERKFRRGWIAEGDHVLTSHDLSQIELRIGAHLSQDPYMLKVYRGELRNPDGSLIDLHAGLGQRIFGKPKQDQTKAERTAMKAINFGFWMGQTAKGLQVELRRNGVFVTEEDAQRWIDEANALYKGTKPYKDRMVAEARRNGYVRCLSGRIRYIGGINSKIAKVREEAERFAFSTPIQEGAQYVMKHAEVYIWNMIQRQQAERRWVEPILQIHDDMLLEWENPKLAREMHPEMVHAMTKTFTPGLSVPIETSGSFGPNWAQMEDF